MTSRISGGLSARNPFGVQWGNSKETARTEGPRNAGEQIQSALFGRPKPPIVDTDDAILLAQVARLHSYRKRIARLAGDSEDDYDLVLADGTIAMIDESGRIYVGRQFVLDHLDAVEVQVGVLAHEIGHRPKRWNEYKSEQPFSKEEAERLCRIEETRADYFAGRALAELGLTADPLVAFLLRVSVHPHPEYFPAPMRADAIREGFTDGKRKSTNRKKLFPELHRWNSPETDLGNG
jgi:hypothetical protein